MKKFSINLNRIWSPKVDFSNSIFQEMKSFMISFRSSDVQHILIDKLGLPAFCLGKQEDFMVSGNSSLGLAFKSVSNKIFIKKE